MKLFRVWMVVCSSMLALALTLALVPSSAIAQMSKPGIKPVPSTTTTYTFTAFFTEGSKVPTKLEAPLKLSISKEGRVSGVLFLKDSRSRTLVPVRGYVSDNNIVLTFDLGKGGIIKGRGEFIRSSIKGTFTGPERGDSGVWSAVPAK